ncbi:tail fiber receptor binding protein [Klebsiella phage Metamorpho]|nr:tail fiber receptor binding protein [Klebsiella phage Metamorpho]
MAVTGPWVGSSAKAETGQAWMKQAGEVLRMSTPFWMSNMIGRSKWHFTFVPQERWYNNTRWRGVWRKGADTGVWYNISDSAYTIVGDYNGKQIGTIGAVGDVISGSNLTIYDGPNRNVRILFTRVDNNQQWTFNFNISSYMRDGFRNYDIYPAEGNNWYSFLNGNVGVTISGIITEI